MNRKSFLFGNLVLLLGFAAGYAASALTSKKAEHPAPAAAPAIITQPAPSTDAARETNPTPPAAATAAAASEASQEVATLQKQLAEKNAKIAELQQKLATPTHDTVTPDEDTPEYREKLAADLMEVSRTKDMIQQSFKASAQMMGKDLSPEGQEALSQAMNRIYGWDKMEKMFSKVYTDVFSAQELNDMTEFYRSDVGAAMLKKQPEVMQKTMQLVQQINQDATPKMMAEFEAIRKKHSLKTAGGRAEVPPTKN